MSKLFRKLKIILKFNKIFTSKITFTNISILYGYVQKFSDLNLDLVV